MDTKYNLSITTSGEDGDHASTNISTSDPGKLADILQLAGMSGGHPVPMNAQAAPEESHGTCDVCSGMHEDDEHVAEGDSWDNEPDVVVHSPEEITQTGNDLHKVKKTYPKVNGGDNPMALAETELRAKYENFLAEKCQPELGHKCWPGTLEKPESDHDHDSHDHGKTNDDFWTNKKRQDKEAQDRWDAHAPKPEKKKWRESAEKNMNIKEVLELVDNIELTERGADDASNKTHGSGKRTWDGYRPGRPGREKVFTPAEKQTGKENNQSGGSGRQKQVFSKAPKNTGGPEGSSDERYGSKRQGRDESVQPDGNALTERGRDDAEIPSGGYGSYEYDKHGNLLSKPIKVFDKPEKQTGRENNQSGGSYEYDKDGNLLSEPIKVFDKAERQSGPEGGSGEIYGSKSDKPAGYGREEGLMARKAAAAEAGFATLKQARAAGHPAGSEHTWTGSGAHAWPPKLSDEEKEREMGYIRQDSDAEEQESYLSQNLDSIIRDQEHGEALQDTDIGGHTYGPGHAGYPDEPTAEEKARYEAQYAEEKRLLRQNAGLPVAKPPRTRTPVFTPAEKQTGKENNQSGGSGKRTWDGYRPGRPGREKVFTPAPKQTGRENNQSGGVPGSKPVFTKAPKQGGRDN